MVLIFGGAYQGRLDYAKKNYSIKTVCDCSDGREPDTLSDAVYGLEGYVRRCVSEGLDALEFFRENIYRFREKVIILQDVSQGVVPLDAQERAFREMNGRLMIYLAEQADEAVRVFCGMGMRIK